MMWNICSTQQVCCLPRISTVGEPIPTRLQIVEKKVILFISLLKASFYEARAGLEFTIILASWVLELRHVIIWCDAQVEDETHVPLISICIWIEDREKLSPLYTIEPGCSLGLCFFFLCIVIEVWREQGKSVVEFSLKLNSLFWNIFEGHNRGLWISAKWMLHINGLISPVTQKLPQCLSFKLNLIENWANKHTSNKDMKIVNG